MNRWLAVIVAAITLVFAASASAQAPDACTSVQWTLAPSHLETDYVIQHLASVDYDEDGKLDLVGVLNNGPGYRGMLFWWKGGGDNTFRERLWTFVLLTSNDTFTNIVIADATGDGLSDVITVVDNQAHPKLVILPATGSGRGPALIKTLGKPGFMTITAIQRDVDPAVELVLNAGSSRRLDVYDDIATTATLVASVDTEMTPTGITGADFDGDGNFDMAVAMPGLEERGLHLYFGEVNGTFETPVALPSIHPFRVEAGDLDEDGRPDLVAGNWKKVTPAGTTSATASIYLNQGGRSFIHSGIPLAKLDGLGTRATVMLHDVSGDGHLDLLAGDDGPTATAIGRGDGTFLTPTFESLRSGSRTAGDFDGDGNLELAMGYSALYVATSSCATQVSLGNLRSIRYSNATLPVASLIGEEVDLQVEISGFGPGPPMRHGRVTLRDNGTVLDSSFVDPDGHASFVVAGLAIGQHRLTAEFSGNAAVPAATSEVLSQWVGQPTPVVVSLPGKLPVYGERFPVQITVNNFRWYDVTLDIDGVGRELDAYQQLYLSLEPGEHSVSAKFAGTHDLPPGQSALLTFTVPKGNPVLELKGPLALRDSAHALAFAVQGSGAVGPTGFMELIEGTTTIASGALVNGSATLNVALSRGAHDVRAVYSGDTRYRESASNLKLEVIPDLPFPIAARAMADEIHIAYILPANAIASTLQLHRRAAGTTEWVVVPSWNAVTGMDASVPRRGVTYEYQLIVTFKNASRSYSSIDSATLPHPRRRAVSP